MSEQESPNKLSSRTTPTWEVELLISGGAAFAMLQLPGWLDDGMFMLAPRLDASWAKLVELLYYYAKSAAVILAATFVIHLLLRARWTALVGMHSVYPNGVQWDKLRIGPIQRSIERHREIPTEDIIERADNLATTVFAIGVMLAMVLVMMTIGVAMVLGTSTLIAGFLGWKELAMQLVGVAFVLFMLPYVLLATLDRRFGKDWKQDGVLHRSTRSVLELFARIGMRPGNNRIRALLASNSGDRRIGVMIFLIIAISIFTVMMAYWGMRNGAQLGNYEFFPADASTRLDASHYDDQRDTARDPAVPYVQSMVAEGAYLQLVLPYDPRRDGAALHKDCPRPDATRDAALLACLQAMHPVSLDGKPIDDLHFEIASDMKTRRPALLAMIDIRTLAPGRHELRVGDAPLASKAADAAHDESDAESPGVVIPFWR